MFIFPFSGSTPGHIIPSRIILTEFSCKNSISSSLKEYSKSNGPVILGKYGYAFATALSPWNTTYLPSSN